MNVEANLIFFKDYSLFQQYNQSLMNSNVTTLDYYSPDITMIEKTKSGFFTKQWRLTGKKNQINQQTMNDGIENTNLENISNNGSIINGTKNNSTDFGIFNQTYTIAIRIKTSNFESVQNISGLFHLLVDDNQTSILFDMLKIFWITMVEIAICCVSCFYIYESISNFDPLNSQEFLLSWLSIISYFGKSEKPSGVNIIFKNLEVNGPTRTLLKNVSGFIPAQSFTAVMGKSGCGKTTLVNAIGKRNYGLTTTYDELSINKKPLTSSRKKAVGYVPQMDIMIGYLQVFETILFSALYRSSFHNLFNIRSTLQDLNISDLAASTIGDDKKKVISGGQKKRVNIAIEMVNENSLLILDEPTSGLDSSTAEDLINNLKKNVSKSTVICIIHQPSREIYDSFDYLIFVNEGKIIAHDNAQSILEYCCEKRGLESSTVADPGEVVFEYLSRFENPIDSICSLSYVLSEFIQPTQQPIDTNIVIRNVPFYVQAFACLLRCFLQTIHQLTTLLGDLILNSIGGFIIAALFSGNLIFQGQSSESIYNSCPNQMKEICGQPNVDSITGFTGTLVLAMSLTSIMSSLKIFGAEKLNFQKREIESGINTMVYYLTKCIYSLIYIILDALSFTLAFYFIVKPKESFSFYLLYTFLTMFTTFPIGYIISTILSESVAQITCVVFIFINYMFAGLTPSLPELSGMPLPFPFLPYLSFLRYVNELLYVHEVQHYNNMFEKSISLKGYVRELDEFYISMILTFAFIFYSIGALVVWQSCPDSLFFSIKYQVDKIIQRILLKYHRVIQKIKCCKVD